MRSWAVAPGGLHRLLGGQAWHASEPRPPPLARSRQDSLPNRMLNIAGPDRLSLYDMGLALAQVGRERLLVVLGAAAYALGWIEGV